jgi:membrane protease YdiL (CAAX protease family)
VALFIAGALLIREVPVLRNYAESVLAHARFGSLPLVAVITLVNGIAEEIFFRGALFAAVGVRHPVLISTAVYAVTTFSTGNPVLAFAAAALGVVLGLQRRASGGVLAPILTHITWSMSMLFVLPPVIGAGF